MRKNFLILSILIGVFLVQVPLANANVVFSDNFNSENGGVGVLNYTGFANWTVSGGAVDLIGNGFFDFFPANGLYVDLDGSQNNAGIMTSILVAPGKYIFSFDLAGSQRGDTNTVNVSFGDYAEAITLASSVPFTTYTKTVNVTALSNTIVFDHAGGDNIGLLLDNVSVSTVPLPSALVLLGSGLVGLMGLRRRGR